MSKSSQAQVGVMLHSISEPARAQVALCPNNLIVASPYLTSNTAEYIVESADANTVIVLTAFRAESFVSGASSLETLRRMSLRGFRLLHVDGLHAKVISSPTFCFLGSQNLTAAGQTNKEVSAQINEGSVIQEVNDGMMAWLELAIPITSEMIEDMERQVAPLIEAFTSLRITLELIDQSVAKAEASRAASRKTELDKMERAATLEAVHSVYRPLLRAARSRPTSHEVALNLQHISGSWSSWNSHHTLLAGPSDDLTTWWVDGEVQQLTKRLRYLLIAPETGKLGWPALNKTRLTRFGTDLTPSNTSIRLDGILWKVAEIVLNQDMSSLSSWNVKFELEHNGGRYHLLMRYTLDDLVLFQLVPAVGTGLLELGANLTSFPSALSRQLKRVLTDSFRYKSNSRGIGAKDFCEGLSSYLRLTLKSEGFRHFLCLESR